MSAELLPLPESAAETPETPVNQLVWLSLGDLELRLNAGALRRLALANIDGMLQSGAGSTAATFAIRGAAVALFPTLRKLLRQHAPDMPLPEIPRGADPVTALAAYLADAVVAFAVRRRWALEYRERTDGAIELTGAREVAAVVVEAVEVDVVSENPGGASERSRAPGSLDTADAKRASRGPKTAGARRR